MFRVFFLPGATHSFVRPHSSTGCQTGKQSVALTSLCHYHFLRTSPSHCIALVLPSSFNTTPPPLHSHTQLDVEEEEDLTCAALVTVERVSPVSVSTRYPSCRCEARSCHKPLAGWAQSHPSGGISLLVAFGLENAAATRRSAVCKSA